MQSSIIDHKSFEGKVLEALSSKAETDFTNVEDTVFSKALENASAFKNSRNHYAGFSTSDFNNGTGTIWYDTSSTSNPVLKILNPNGTWENLTGLNALLSNYFSFYESFEKTYILDTTSEYCYFSLNEYVKNPETMMLIIAGIIYPKHLYSLGEDKLTVTFYNPNYGGEEKQSYTISVRYFNSIPNIYSEAGLDTLGDIKSTYLQPGTYLTNSITGNSTAPKFLPNGAVLADGTIYNKDDTDFSYELYNILYLNVNDTKTIPSSRVIMCQTFEEWEEEAQRHYTEEGEYYNENFALDREDFTHYDLESNEVNGSVRYRVPKCKANDLLMNYVIVKSVSEEICNLAYMILTGELDYCVEHSEDETTGSWYRLYNSGRLEQGGKQTGTGTFGAVDVTFLKSFNNTDYNVFSQVEMTTLDEDLFNNTNMLTSSALITDLTGVPCCKTATGFKIQGYSNHSWYAFGKIG